MPAVIANTIGVPNKIPRLTERIIWASSSTTESTTARG
jgi:hypothetical protein